MKVLFVVNNLFAAGNGLSASARRTVDMLRRKGLDVRVLSGVGPNGEQADYTLPPGHVPVAQGLISKHGYAFAHKDRRVIREAVAWADLIHFEEPFGLEMAVRRAAERRGVPMTATYHLHPENLFASVHLDHSRFFNGTCMRVWRDLVFDRCAAVQCPTENARARLEQYRFKADVRVISNGLIPRETSLQYPPCALPEDAYVVLCVGCYAVEKDQMTLLRAMRHSAFAGRIQLVLAGRGPTERTLRREAERLTRDGVLRYPPVFGFCDYGQLMAYARRADLYVHCATVEVEGLSCIEVLKEGVVPVIAAGPKTATSQFARSPESVFPGRDAEALARRVDYWLGDDARRKAEARRYLNIQDEYRLSDSADQLIDMFRDAMARTGAASPGKERP